MARCEHTHINESLEPAPAYVHMFLYTLSDEVAFL